MKISRRDLTISGLSVLAGTAIGSAARAQLPGESPYKNLGLVGVKSSHNRYLQAHTGDGELHASNEHRNTEETWFLIQIAASQDLYALLNWETRGFLSKDTNRGCANAANPVLSNTEKWKFISGKPHGVENAILIESTFKQILLGANGPGGGTECGGEVNALQSQPRFFNDRLWGGWWVLEPASVPTKGRDFWTAIGSPLEKFAGQIKPADIVSVLAIVAGKK